MGLSKSRRDGLGRWPSHRKDGYPLFRHVEEGGVKKVGLNSNAAESSSDPHVLKCPLPLKASHLFFVSYFKATILGETGWGSTDLFKVC